MASGSRPRDVAQGLLPYEIEVVPSSASTTGRAGLLLVVETMRALGLEKSIERNVRVRQRNGGYPEPVKIEWLVLLLAAGGECVDDIQLLAADEGLCRLYGSVPPSADALLEFLHKGHDQALIEQAKARRPPGTLAYIPAENAVLSGLGQVNTDLVHAVSAQGKSRRATLDHDATIIEGHKVEAQAHYKGGRGYQPVAVYWAEQDLVVGDEFRDGNVPAGMGNLPLIQRSFQRLPASVTEYYFRADSACYDERVLKWLANGEREGGPMGRIGFSISADMTRQLHNACKAVADEQWLALDERAEETVMCADIEFTSGEWPKGSPPLRYVGLRIQKKQGRLFASGHDTRYLAVVSNRYGDEIDAPQLVRWHWEKAGTIEHVHDVTKNELGAGTLPSGRFGTNAFWYRLSLLTYNVLSAMKSLGMPSSLSSARPKRLRFRVFNIAGRIASHAGTLRLRISEAVEGFAGLVTARLRLATLLPVVDSS